MTQGEVKGFRNLVPTRFTVLFTSDKYGETLSVNDGETQYTFAFEAVEAIIKKERGNK